jgi:hypothetical protein
MPELTLIINTHTPDGRENWICWVEGHEAQSDQIQTVPCGVKWAYEQGTPVSRWKFHGDAIAMSAEALRFSAQDLARYPADYAN